MSTVTYETENGIFHFDLSDVNERLNQYVSEHNVDDASNLLDLLKSSSGDTITIPEEEDYFGYIALNLINDEKGTVKCKTCNKAYQPHDLKPTILGHGESPFKINLNQKKGGIGRLFARKQKLPGMFGGKGYECPEGHELIAMVTWRT